jgi:hypothetical protein
VFKLKLKIDHSGFKNVKNHRTKFKKTNPLDYKISWFKYHTGQYYI